MDWDAIMPMRLCQASSVMIVKAGTEDRKMRRKRENDSPAFKAKAAVTAVRDGFRDSRVGVARRSPAGG